MKEWLTHNSDRPHRYSDSLQFYVFDTLFDNCELYNPKWVAENGIFYDKEEEKIVLEFVDFVDE
ncbi:MAG: hypothetical protein ACRYE9_03140 [Janthinobacterium lividum]